MNRLGQFSLVIHTTHMHICNSCYSKGHPKYGVAELSKSHFGNTPSVNNSILQVNIAVSRKSESRSRVNIAVPIKTALSDVVRRHVFVAFHSLVQELTTEVRKQLRHFVSITGENCDEILHKLSHR